MTECEKTVVNNKDIGTRDDDIFYLLDGATNIKKKRSKIIIHYLFMYYEIIKISCNFNRN